MQMAVFLLNTCKFNGCGVTFQTLGELIQHIEETHIDTDPRVLEKHEIQQPTSLALSYVLKFFSDGPGRERLGHSSDFNRKRPRAQSLSPASSLRSNTPTGSEFDEEEADSDEEDSDDSWTTQEEVTSDLILSMMNNRDSDGEKPFACPIPGCKKRYKNVNGIKYHAKHGHRKDGKVKKAYKCHCGKSYKTAQGLRNHALSSHPPTELVTALHPKLQALVTPSPPPLITPTQTSITQLTPLTVTGQQLTVSGLPITAGKHVTVSGLPITSGQQVKVTSLPVTAGQQVKVSKLPMTSSQQVTVSSLPLKSLTSVPLMQGSITGQLSRVGHITGLSSNQITHVLAPVPPNVVVTNSSPIVTAALESQPPPTVVISQIKQTKQLSNSLTA